MKIGEMPRAQAKRQKNAGQKTGQGGQGLKDLSLAILISDLSAYRFSVCILPQSEKAERSKLKTEKCRTENWSRP
jgi:hypothetical protein